MTPKLADRLVGVTGVLVDTYGCHAVVTVLDRTGRTMRFSNPADNCNIVLHRDDVAEFHPL